MLGTQGHRGGKLWRVSRKGGARGIVVFGLLAALGVGGWLGVQGWLRGQPASLWRQAEQAAKAGDHEASELHLQNLLQKAPEHRDAHLALAKSLVEVAKKDDPRVTYAHHPAAIEHLQRAWELQKDDLDTAELLLAADLRSNRLEQGAPVAEEVLRQKPDHAEALYLLARVAFGKQNFAQVDALLARLKALPNEPRPRTLALAATTAWLTKNNAKYVAALEETLVFAGDAQAEMEDTDLMALQGLLAASVEQANTPVEANRRAAAALAVLERPAPPRREADAALQALVVGGNLAERLPGAAGEVRAEMIKLLERSAKLGGPALAAVPVRPSAFAQAALVEAALGRRDEAEAVLTKGVEALKKGEAPPLAALELHLVAAQLLAAHGRFRSAEAHVAELLKQREGAGWGHLLAGNIAMLEGRYDASLSHLAEARSKLGNTLAVKFSLSRTLIALKRWERALSYLDTLHVDPQTLPPHERRWAEMNLAGGQAVHLLQAQARLAIDDVRGAERHLAELQGGRFEPIAAAMQVAYLWNKGKSQEAAELVQAVRNRFPDDLQLARLHATMLDRRGQNAAAERVLAGLAERHPADLAVQMASCQWLVGQRRFDEALARIAELRERFPQAAALQLLEAQTLLRADRPAEAMQAVQQLDEKSLGEARDVIGVLAALRLNELDEAARGLESLAGSERRNAASTLLEANLASARGETDESIDALQQTMQYTNLRSVAGQLLYRAVLQLAQKEGPAPAADRLRELLDQYPKEPALLMAQVDLQWQQDERAAALTTLESVIEANPRLSWPVFVKAKLLTLEDRRPEAMRVLDDLLQQDRSHLEARVLFASLLMQEQPALAVELIDQGLAVHRDHPRLALLKASALALSNQLDEAIAAAAALEKAQPNFPQTYLLLAQLHVRGNQPDEAVEDVKRGLKQLPGDVGFVRTGIALLCQLRKFEDADKLARMASSSGEVALAATEVFLQAGRLAEARVWAELALKRTQLEQRDAARLLLGDVARAEARQAEGDARGRLLREAGEQYAAVADGSSRWQTDGTVRLLQVQAFDSNEVDAAFERADRLRKDLDPAAAPVALVDALIAVSRKAGKTEAMRSLIDAAVSNRPDQMQYLMAKAELATEQKDFTAVIDEFQKLAQDHPRLAGPSYAQAWLWAQRANPRLALQSLDEALRRQPDLLAARLLAMEQHKRLGNPSEIVRQAEAALEQNPQLWDVHLARAEALREAGLDEEFQAALQGSRDRLQALIQEGSKEVAVHLTLARLHRLNAELDPSEAVLKTALEFAPRDLALVGEMIDLLSARERRSEAEELARTIAEHPETAGQGTAFGRLFYREKLYAAARLAASRELQASTEAERLAADWLLGDVALAEGEADGEREHFLEACEHYRRMLEVQPTHLVAGNNLAWVLVSHLDDPQEALQVAERVRADSPVHALHPSFVDTLARAYRKAGKLAEAQSLLEDSLFVNPEQVSLHLELAQVHVDAGNRAGARKALQAALNLPLDERQAEQVRKQLAELD
ncbi:MAG: tetratricopeptide repeat protein [Planctomycetales bacterium]